MHGTRLDGERVQRRRNAHGRNGMSAKGANIGSMRALEVGGREKADAKRRRLGKDAEQRDQTAREDGWTACCTIVLWCSLKVCFTVLYIL